MLIELLVVVMNAIKEIAKKILNENVEVKKEINIFFDDKGEDLQSIIDNLLLELYKTKLSSNCKIGTFGV